MFKGSNSHLWDDVSVGEIIIKMKGIVKKFPGVVANNHIDFEVRAGEIHALLGENGAGKTTLMNILYGIYRPDEGEIYVRGKRVKIKSPRDAISLGIGMVHQHFMLIQTHTVAENIALSLHTKFFLPTREVEKKIADLSNKYGLKIDPRARIWQLSTGEKQRVEILKALCMGAHVLILDEPTTVLTPEEVKELFKVLKCMVKEGKSVIFVTHKLDEAISISNRITVLRQGKVIATISANEANKRKLAKMMVGREVLFQIKKEENSSEVGSIILKVENLYALNDMGLPAVKGVSFDIREGEILGIAGVAGNGQKELIEVITGLRKASSGKVIIFGKDVTNKSPKEIDELGVAHIPEERVGVGIAPNMSVTENLILKCYRRPPFSKGPFLNKRYIDEYAEKLISEYKIATPSKSTPVKMLSGGNIQRLILAREMSRNPKLIIAAHPTYGLDIGATEQIRRLLLEHRSKGAAILLVSEDLEEVMTLSDRIAVMFQGKIIGPIPTSTVKIEDIGLMMAGETVVLQQR